MNWSGAVDSVATIVRNQFPDHEVVLDVDESVPAVLADEQRAEQILGNLLTNACKYSPLGSAVTVTVRADRDYVSTSVIDQGPGVPAGDRERIFERFTRLGDHMRRTVGGAGLGLFIAKQLAEAMHGAISVDDAPGGGARFTFTLPIASTTAGQTAITVP